MQRDEKDALLDQAKAGANSFIDGGIALHRALKPIEAREFDDALDDLMDARNHLDAAADQILQVVKVAEKANADGEIRNVDEDAEGGNDEAVAAANRKFEHLRRKASIERLFYDDPELWEYLTSSVASSDPLAGYALMHTFVVRLRNSVDGLIADIESGEEVERLQNASWRMLRLYVRSMNLGNVLSYVNRETRGGL